MWKFIAYVYALSSVINIAIDHLDSPTESADLMTRVAYSTMFQDKTIYIKESKDFSKVNSTIQTGIYYEKSAGGVGNQLYSFISTLLYAEILEVPFLCCVLPFFSP